MTCGSRVAEVAILSAKQEVGLRGQNVNGGGETGHFKIAEAGGKQKPVMDGPDVAARKQD